MNPDPTNPPAVLEQKAKVFANIAGDFTEEALTGEAHEQAVNEAEAKAWQEKSDRLQEAAANGTMLPPPIQK
jgi:hypothetical protein